jgi:predicted nucleotidyltransferase component of viral defense system
MIGRGEIAQRAQRDGVDAQTVERDYVLAHVAIEIAAVAGEHLVLKGGTSLRLAHFMDYRYSADLDFSLVDVNEREAHDLISTALAQCRKRIGADTLELDTAVSRRRFRSGCISKPLLSPV